MASNNVITIRDLLRLAKGNVDAIVCLPDGVDLKVYKVVQQTTQPIAAVILKPTSPLGYDLEAIEDALDSVVAAADDLRAALGR